MSNQDIDKAFVSPYDKFLFTYDRDHEKTASQLKEIKKHQRIASLRDDATTVVAVDEIWTEF